MKSDELISQMVRAVNMTARPFTAELERKHGISLNEWRCLRTLSRNGKTASARELSDLTGLDKMSTSRALKALERKQLVSRKRSADDRRSFSVELSREGKKLVSMLLPLATERADLMLRPLTAAQRKSLGRALDAIIEHAQADD